MSFAVRRPWAVLATAAVLAVLSIAATTRVKIDTDILSLVPEENRVVQQFITTLDRFGSADVLLVVVRIDDGDVDAAMDAADLITAELEASDEIDWVEERLEDPGTLLAPLLDRSTLFLPPPELERVVSGLERGTLLSERARWLRSQLLSPHGMVVEGLLRADPLGFLPALANRVGTGLAGARVDPETGYFIDPDQRMLLILAKPARAAQDIGFTQGLLTELEQVKARVAQAWAEHGFDAPLPEIELGGRYVIANEDRRLITSDVVVGSLTALIAVMLLFVVAFRRWASLVYAFVPLIVGLLITFGFAAVALGRLNSLTSGFAALLIGLGIDFVIVLYGRYVEGRRSGLDHAAAIAVTGSHTGVGVLLGAVTTAATFYSFLITDFRGLSELGLVTGTGILILVATVFLVLPALLTVIGGERAPAERLYLHSFGSDLMCRYAVARPRVVVVLIGLATAVALVGLSQLRFDDDIRNMRSSDNAGVALQEEVMEAFGVRFTPMMIRIDGDDQDEVVSAARRLLPELDQLVSDGVLAGVDSVVPMIPPREQQEQNLSILDRLDVDPDTLRNRFATALREQGLNPAPFADGFEHVLEALSVTDPLSTEDFVGTPLEPMVGRYFARADGTVSTVIYAYPPPGRWRRSAPPELEALVAVEPHAILTGPNVISPVLRELVWSDAAWATALGLVVVLILLAADLGSMRGSLLALAPLALGVVWMFAAMAMLGLDVNFMNVFVLTMVIGIGVDYGVHLLHRYRESGGDPLALSETAKAIAVAALTTVAGFGSMVLSHYPGLRSVGAAAILGAVATAVLSITVLPALLVWSGTTRPKG